MRNFLVEVKEAVKEKEVALGLFTLVYVISLLTVTALYIQSI